MTTPLNSSNTIFYFPYFWEESSDPRGQLYEEARRVKILYRQKESDLRLLAEREPLLTERKQISETLSKIVKEPELCELYESRKFASFFANNTSAPAECRHREQLNLTDTKIKAFLEKNNYSELKKRRLQLIKKIALYDKVEDELKMLNKEIDHAVSKISLLAERLGYNYRFTPEDIDQTLESLASSSQNSSSSQASGANLEGETL